MNVVLSGVWVLAMLVASGFLLAQTIFGTSSVQADALKDASRVNIERARTRIVIASSSETGGGAGTDLTFEVDNEGEVTIVQKSQMDVLVRYTDTGDALQIKRLAHISSCPAGDNQWCRDSLSPDALNPTLWDPDERATFKARVAPAIKPTTTYTLVVVAPNGISGTGNFVR